MITATHGPRVDLGHCRGEATPADALRSVGMRKWCDCRESAASTRESRCQMRAFMSATGDAWAGDCGDRPAPIAGRETPTMSASVVATAVKTCTGQSNTYRAAHRARRDSGEGHQRSESELPTWRMISAALGRCDFGGGEQPPTTASALGRDRAGEREPRTVRERSGEKPAFKSTGDESRRRPVDSSRDTRRWRKHLDGGIDSTRTPPTICLPHAGCKSRGRCGPTRPSCACAGPGQSVIDV